MHCHLTIYMVHNMITIYSFYVYGFINFGISHCGINSIIGTPVYDDVIVRVATCY